MASANKNTGKSASGRSANTQNRSSAGSTTSRTHSSTASSTASRSRSKKNVKKAPLISILKESPAGRFLLILVAVICILGLDFLVSLNQFDRFFLLLGIELIAAVLIGWILFVLRGRIDEDN